MKQMVLKWITPALMAVLLLPLGHRNAWSAVIGPDLEKPKPVFTRQADTIVAKFIPRAKSTSIRILFTASPGKLMAVEGKDFEEAKRPEVDEKDFRSGLFVLHARVAPGEETTFALESRYFNSSTQLWVFNDRKASAWAKAEIQNISLPDHVNRLALRVKDGGPLDQDGKADGTIVLSCAPKDSFWGYAIGTLFIRFFGIFLVLSMLMIGMILSGKVFGYLERRGQRRTDTAPPEPQASAPKPSEMDPETVAAIATGLHLYFSSAGQPATAVQLADGQTSAWSLRGREKMMAARQQLFERDHRR